MRLFDYFVAVGLGAFHRAGVSSELRGRMRPRTLGGAPPPDSYGRVRWPTSKGQTKRALRRRDWWHPCRDEDAFFAYRRRQYDGALRQAKSWG